MAPYDSSDEGSSNPAGDGGIPGPGNVLEASSKGKTLYEDQHRPPVLVVDDEIGYREGIRRILAGRGFEAETAENGLRALELVEQKDFPIVLVDLKMPGVDGFELIREVRSRRPQTLCIVVSAFATVESAVRTTKMGAFDFVVKPFTPDDLMVVVGRATETWRLTREADRLRAEREAHLLELSAEKSRLRTILQAMGDGLLVVNIDGDIVLDNPVSRRLLGRVQIPMLSGPLGDVIPDKALKEAVDKLLHDEGDSQGIALELRLVNTGVESDRYLSATLTPVYDGADGTLGVLIILADITDSKALERMKKMFVSLVAHELKAPIGAVEGYLHMMAAGTFDADPDRLHQVASRCLDRTGALLCLIQDLLETTKRDSGQQNRNIEAVDFVGICNSIADFHKPEAEKRNIQVTVEAAANLAPVLADRSDLERAVTNLLSNAIKYNRDDGRVVLRLYRTEATVVLEVEDTGIGMSPEEKSRLGEEFFRAKNSRTRGVTGTGLGIVLVKKIAESYNGALEVESVLDTGSKFRMLLPLAQAAMGDKRPSRF